MGRTDSPLRERMLFVVGARRSGTNWVQRVLTAHPGVVAVPTETYLFARGLAPLEQRFQHAAIGSLKVGSIYMPRDDMLDAFRDLCDRVFGGILEALDPGAQYLLERSPGHADVLDLLGAVYPDARVVHIVRDGRDVARSLVSQDWGPDGLADAAAEWRDSVSKARAAGASLQHYVEVRYEELLSDPRRHVADLYRRLDLAADDRVLAGALTEAGVSYNADPRMPEIGSGKWRSVFSAADVALFESIAGDLLVDLGYGRAAEEGSTPKDATAPAAAKASPPQPPLDVVTRLRRRLGRLRRRLLAGAPSRAGSDAENLRRLRAASVVVDEVLAAMARGDGEAVATRLAPAAQVRLIGPSGDWEGRGDEARARLAAAVAADPAIAGRQVRGDLHPSLPVNTLVATWRTEDGMLHDRVTLVGVVDDLVSRVVRYELPPREATGRR